VTDKQAARVSWEQIDDEECRRAADVIEFVGRRWSSGILLAVARGAERFREIAVSVTGLSDRMLALRLKELEREGLLTRIVEPTTPVSIRYRLTPRGRELMALLHPLVTHAQRWPTPKDDATDRR
jgi:DNA-binding HxlR family transcriptional regulator